MAASDSWAMAASALAVAADASENQLFVNRNLSTLGRKSAQRRHFWAMSICGHCRCHAPTTKVFTCYGMKAHHREVVSVDAQGARESVGILSPRSEQLMLKKHVLPEAPQAGTVVDLDPNSTVEPDDKVTFLLSCEGCAGLPLGECINKRGHVQQVRPIVQYSSVHVHRVFWLLLLFSDQAKVSCDRSASCPPSRFDYTTAVIRERCCSVYDTAAVLHSSTKFVPDCAVVWFPAAALISLAAAALESWQPMPL